MKSSGSLVLTVAILFQSPLSFAQSASQMSIPQPSTHAMSMANEQIASIPFFSQADGMRSTLWLNNNSLHEKRLNITIFNAEGKGFAVPALTLRPISVQELSLDQLLKNASGKFETGSLEVMYQGNSMEVTCQVGISMLEKRISFESREADMMDFKSSNLNAIVWMPDQDDQAFIALTNVATTKTSVDFSVGNYKKEISLSPHQTELLHLNENLRDSGLHEHGTASLLRLHYSGEPGSLITTGFVLNTQKGYSSNFTLVDPATIRSAHLSGAALRFGFADLTEGFPPDMKLRAPLVLANIGTRPLTARVSVDYTLSKMGANLLITEVQLRPNEIKILELTDELAKQGITGPVEDAGVDITYDGKPGALIAHLTSLDQTGDYSFDLPIKDPVESTHMSVNTYPWSLEDGSKTVLHLKNTTPSSAWALVQFRFPGGTYYPDRVRLQPFQTVAVDIQQLKTTRQKDTHGRLFPETAMSGQVEWSEEIPGTIIGRAELVNAASGTVRSFSCGTCVCPPTPNGSYLTPSSYIGNVGEIGNFFTPAETRADCNQNTSTFYPSPISSWSSTNTAVANVSSSGQVSCLKGGTTTINAHWTDTFYYQNGPDTCAQGTVQQNPGGGMTVQGQVACTNVTRGGTTTCTVTPSGVVVTGWSFKDAKGNTVTRGSNVTSHTWSGVMAASGTVSVTVSGTSTPLTASITVSNRTTFAFTAVSPVQLATNSITCYKDTTVHVLPSPPSPGSPEGYSCADLAYSFTFTTVSDGGPNNGYEYVTTATDSPQGSPTKFEYIVVSDVLATGTSFYTHQCGTFSSSNSSGFIAGSQLKQNIFDHEQGSVLSHWTEYRDAQNNSSNNIGTVVEAATGSPGSTGNTFAQTPGDSALDRIAQAVKVEPCGGTVNEDSSQSCKTCGAINFTPYVSCGTAQPVAHCQ